MRGEGGERLLNALLVTKVYQYCVQHGYDRLLICGDMQSRLCHQRKQTKRFERNGLTARIGTRDNYGIVSALTAKADVDGYNTVAIDQGMSCTYQAEGSVLGKCRCGCVHRCGQLRASEAIRKSYNIIIVQC